MSDMFRDPNLQRGPEDMGQYDKRVQWAAVGVLLLLCGGIFVAAMYSGSETQTAMNRPAVETTGSGSASPIPTQPPR